MLKSVDILENELMHYGTPRHSGRYPWGSGENPYQHCSTTFLTRVQELKDQGFSTEKDICEALGMSSVEFRALKAYTKDIRRMELIAKAKGLKEQGYSNQAIAKELNLAGESSVRALFKDESEANTNKAISAADFLKRTVDEKGFVDIGKGVDAELGISSTKMEEVKIILKDQGYEIYPVRVEQATNPGMYTTVEVLCPPGTKHKDVYGARDDGTIFSVADNYHSPDGGETFNTVLPPKSISSDRIKVRYGDQGGAEKDGVIELRRGVEDISLGDSQYAQVRIAVDGTHYLKGMAIYSDDLPKGVDILFNTNKNSDIPKMDTFKKMKTEDPNNPFGALIKANGQRFYIDEHGKKQQSVINKVREEGDWNQWEKTLSSQFLSKQSKELIQKQLKLTYAEKEAEFEEICSLTNPAIKQHFLQSFSDDCDSAAVHLKMAALPRQRSQVILPISSMKDNEIYAPNYRNGEKVALIRYPHGGTFEIPILTVNNKHPRAKSILRNAQDAVGINSHVASILSGADFDGDTVTVIPCGRKVKIQSKPPLKDLEGFDPKTAYPYRDGMKVMSNTNLEMGKISNLITDMTLGGASESELARAVKHSMVVIDAEKHKLNYKQSYIDNDIPSLKRKYQLHYDENGKEHYGANTLMSRKNQDISVPERVGSVHIDKDTGKYIYKTSGRVYEDKKGNTVTATSKAKLILETDDVRTIGTGTYKELMYGDYSNKMKALANKARKEQMATKNLVYSKEAKQKYAAEVASLEAKRLYAEKHRPKERRAQVIANSRVKAILDDNPHLKVNSKEIKKARQLAIEDARAQVGIKRKERVIDISDREWEAIQAGAISHTKLKQILANADTDALRERATPRQRDILPNSKINKIRAMNSTYSTQEIADALGISVTTVLKYIKEGA